MHKQVQPTSNSNRNATTGATQPAITDMPLATAGAETSTDNAQNTASESTRRKNLGQLLINCSEDQLALATTCSHTARNHPKFVKLAESS